MPDPSVNSSTLNRDLNLGTTHNLFCHDIVSNNVIYTDALSATGMMMSDAIAVTHTSTLNDISCQTVQVNDTVNVNNSLTANVLQVSTTLDAANATSCMPNNVAATSLAVSGASILHATTVNGNMSVNGILSASSFSVTSGWIKNSETVNLLTDMTWSNLLSFNSTNHLYGGIDLCVICETLHYEFSTTLLLSKAKANSSSVCIFVLGSDTTSGVGISF